MGAQSILKIRDILKKYIYITFRNHFSEEELIEKKVDRKNFVKDNLTKNHKIVIYRKINVDFKRR